MNYAQQIKHPLWQKKRLEVLEDHDFTCQDCGAKDIELHVHHPFYTRGAMIWDYETSDLHCLCNVCHKSTHAIDELLKKGLACLDSRMKFQVLGYIDVMYHPPVSLESGPYMVGYMDGMRTNDRWVKTLLTKEWGKK